MSFDSSHTLRSVAHTKLSTYNDQSVLGSKQFMMLLILILNNVVDKMLPCGTPCESLNVSDKVKPTRTWIDRSARKLSKKFAYLPLTPSSCRVRVDHVKFHTSKWYHMLFPSQKTQRQHVPF